MLGSSTADAEYRERILEAYDVSKSPYISIVMSAYNDENLVSDSIVSMLRQTVSDFEFIIIDDGSQDQTADFISELARQDQRIRFCPRPHEGLVSALNVGCRLANSEYIARIDSDDIALPDRLALQIRHLENNPEIALLGGATECIDLEGFPHFTMRWPSIKQNLHDYLLLDCYVAHTTVMFRKSVFLEIGGYREAYLHAEDYDLFLRFSDKHLIDNLEPVLCRYRMHSGQVSSTQLEQQVISGIAARLATRARRMGRAEPRWSSPIRRQDIRERGIQDARVDRAIAEYDRKNQAYAEGWRWSGNRFCEIP